LFVKQQIMLTENLISNADEQEQQFINNLDLQNYVELWQTNLEKAKKNPYKAKFKEIVLLSWEDRKKQFEVYIKTLTENDFNKLMKINKKEKENYKKTKIAEISTLKTLSILVKLIYFEEIFPIKWEDYQWAKNNENKMDNYKKKNMSEGFFEINKDKTYLKINWENWKYVELDFLENETTIIINSGPKKISG